MAEDKVDEPAAEAPVETPAEAPKDAEAPTDADPASDAKDGGDVAADAGDAAAAEAPPAFDLANKLTPLFLSGASQEIFECIADSPDGVTEDAPQKFIQKEKILEDMRMRAAVSDFSVVKEEMKVRSNPCAPPRTLVPSLCSLLFSCMSACLLVWYMPLSLLPSSDRASARALSLSLSLRYRAHVYADYHVGAAKLESILVVAMWSV